MKIEILNKCNIRLESDIETIRNSILKRLNQIDAIILCGGYGRGEGSWVIDNLNSKVYPYNDYDLYIVSDMKPSSKIISEIKNEISNKVGLKWIDIDTITKFELTRLKPSIKNIDLKYASKVIHGDNSILNKIPDIDPKEISTLDIETLYFTRLWTFMGSLSENGFINLDIEEARFFKNQMAKALLACVDVLLLQKNQYNTSYIKRLNLAKGLYPNKEWLMKLGQWAINEKSFPSSKCMSGKEVHKLYSEVHKIFGNEMARALSKHYLLKLNYSSMYDINVFLMPYYFTRRIYHRVLRRSREFETSILIRRVQNYLFFAYKQENIDESMLLKANKLLTKLENVNCKLDWHQARLKIAKIRNGGE